MILAHIKTLLRKIEPCHIFIQAHGAVLYLGVLVIIVAAFTTLRISGTSAGIYHDYFYGAAVKDPALIFGEPRDIRSDEFTVATAWTVSQAHENYPRVNPLYGISGQSFLFYDGPIKDFTLIFKPQNWGFLFLPLEQAFALKWWLRGALFIFSAFLILLRISNRQVLFSIMGSLALFFAPHIQWWYSVTMMDIVTYNFLLFECLIRLVRFQNLRQLWEYTALFGYLWVVLILLFYPPTQIIFGGLFILLASGLVWQERVRFNRTRIKILLLALCGSAAAIAGVMIVFFIQYRPMIAAVQNTVYPGQRTAYGGGFNLIFLLGSFYNIQLQNKGVQIPAAFSSNQSMASGFFLYALFLLPVIAGISIYRFSKKARLDFWAIFLSLIFLVFLAWEIFGSPPVLGHLLRIDSIPPIRVLLALGVLNMVIAGWYLYRVEIPRGHAFLVISILLSTALALFYLGFGAHLRSSYPGFLLSARKITGIAIMIGLTFFLLLQKKPLLFAALLFAFSSVSSYRVNPLYQGLGQLSSGQLAETIGNIHRSDPQDARWILYDAPLMLNYLQANGIPALSATYYYPDLALWRVLDPTGQYNVVYNRYARTLFHPASIPKPNFKLTYRDAMSVSIDPCAQQMTSLNVKYHVFPYAVHFSCLREVSRVDYPAVQFYIYKIQAGAP